MKSFKHTIIDCKGVSSDICKNDKLILETIENVARKNGLNVINASRYRFGHNSPDGCTVFVMLDESHISLHTYAEEGRIAIDLFMREDINRNSIINEIKERLNLKDISIKEISRF